MARCLVKRDENGKLIEGVKFDLRTEIGVAHELGRQAIPVIVNESIVRGLYFARRLFTEIKESNVERVSDLKTSIGKRHFHLRIELWQECSLFPQVPLWHLILLMLLFVLVVLMLLVF